MSNRVVSSDPLAAIGDELLAAARRRAAWRERTVTIRGRRVGLLGARSSSATLAWLASHRDRLSTLLLGGWRLSILVIWDRRGGTLVERSDEDDAAISQLVNGDGPPLAPNLTDDEWSTVIGALMPLREAWINQGLGPTNIQSTFNKLYAWCERRREADRG